MFSIVEVVSLFLFYCKIRLMSSSNSSTTRSPPLNLHRASTMAPKSCRVAVIGGGIAGACVASTLAQLASTAATTTTTTTKDEDIIVCSNMTIHVYDQGKSGVGGRTSHRVTDGMRWDHGCQFFRADTVQFQQVVSTWIDKKLAVEWKGKFVGEEGAADFFGLPSQPPFYVGVGGIKSIARGLLHNNNNNEAQNIQVFEGTRVSGMERNDTDKTWKLFGTSGEAAYHDTAESIANKATTATAAADQTVIGEGYDAIVLTDISSSFATWHRASAGVPVQFAHQVRERAGARVPLFTCMVAFETPIQPSDMSAATVNDPTLWFAARTNAKPGLLDDLKYDCWTLVSTPEYALQKIQDTPMQDPETGEFVPQTPEYLTTVPGPELEASFRSIVEQGRLGKVDGGQPLLLLPKTVFLGAQRWGSALPAHRHLTETSETRNIISGVAYDAGRHSLAPTRQEKLDGPSFVADEELMLFQAGDMVSSYTPGFEGAALSGIDAAQHVFHVLSKGSKVSQ